MRTPAVNKTLAALLSIFPVMACVIGYVISVETRFASLDDQQAVLRRVENLERMMFPVLVEFRLMEETVEVAPADLSPLIESPKPDGVELHSDNEGPPSIEDIERMVEEQRQRVSEEVQQDIKRYAPEFKPQ